MKKVFAILLAVLTIATACTAAFAASPAGPFRISEGVCAGIQVFFRHGVSCHGRLHDLAAPACSHADSDGDGLCDSCGASCSTGGDSGNGAHHNDQTCSHADSDGDGLCDSCGVSWSTGGGSGNGTHHGSGRHGGGHNR